MKSTSYNRRWMLANRRMSRFFLTYLPLVGDIMFAALNLERTFGNTEGLLYAKTQVSLGYEISADFISVIWWFYFMLSSRAAGFCRLHRLNISYLFVGGASIYVQRWHGHGEVIHWLAASTAILGTLLVLHTIGVIIKRRGLCRRISRV